MTHYTTRMSIVTITSGPIENAKKKQPKSMTSRKPSKFACPTISVGVNATAGYLIARC